MNRGGIVFCEHASQAAALMATATVDSAATDGDVCECGDIPYEAAVSIYDSGCGLLVEHAGEWNLAGIATAVETN